MGNLFTAFLSSIIILVTSLFVGTRLSTLNTRTPEATTPTSVTTPLTSLRESAIVKGVVPGRTEYPPDKKYVVGNFTDVKLYGDRFVIERRAGTFMNSPVPGGEKIYSSSQNKCSPAQFIDPIPGGYNPLAVDQTWADISGRYIVWEQDGPQSVRIAGYDLGPDLLFKTSDDTGPIYLTSAMNYYQGGTTLRFATAPQVSSGGTVTFVRDVILDQSTGEYEVQLVTCAFSSCANTLKVIDKIPTFFIGIAWFPAEGFNWFDLDDKTMVFARVSIMATGGPLAINKYNLSTGTTVTVTQKTTPSFPKVETITDLSVDESGLISWVDFTFDYLNQINNSEDFYMVLPNTANPILVNSQSLTMLNGPPQLGNLYDTKSVALNQKYFAFFPTPEQSQQYWDLGYMFYDATLKGPYIAGGNDNRHNVLPVAAISKLANQKKLLLAFQSFDVSSITIDALVYDQAKNIFTSIGFTPPPVNSVFGFINTMSMSGRNIVSGADANLTPVNPTPGQKYPYRTTIVACDPSSKQSLPADKKQ